MYHALLTITPQQETHTKAGIVTSPAKVEMTTGTAYIFDRGDHYSYSGVTTRDNAEPAEVWQAGLNYLQQSERYGAGTGTLSKFRELCRLARVEEEKYARMADVFKTHATDTEREADPRYRNARKRAQEALDTINSAVDDLFPQLFPHIGKERFNDRLTARGRIFSAIFRINHPEAK